MAYTTGKQLSHQPLSCPYGLYHRKPSFPLPVVYPTAALPPTTILPLRPIPQETFISTSCGIPHCSSPTSHYAALMAYTTGNLHFHFLWYTPLQLSHQPLCCPYGLYHRINLFPCSIPHGSFPTNRHTSPTALAAKILAGKESQT